MKYWFWDIETAPMESFHWQPKTDYITHDFNEQETTILCVAWKDSDQKKIHVDGVSPRKPRDDRRVVKVIHEQLMRCAEENIVIVHQNGDRFDLPKIKSRAIYHNLTPIPKLTTIDTLKKARQIGFDYKRLDYLDKYLHGDEYGKVETRGWIMWRDVVSRHSNPQKREKALKEMLHYNKGDILALERVFNRLSPWFENMPNINLWQETLYNCPGCGSDNVIYRAKPHFTQTRAYRRKSCNDCGRWFRETKSIKQYSSEVRV